MATWTRLDLHELNLTPEQAQRCLMNIHYSGCGMHTFTSIARLAEWIESVFESKAIYLSYPDVYGKDVRMDIVQRGMTHMIRHADDAIDTDQWIAPVNTKAEFLTFNQWVLLNHYNLSFAVEHKLVAMALAILDCNKMSLETDNRKILGTLNLIGRAEIEAMRFHESHVWIKYVNDTVRCVAYTTLGFEPTFDHEGNLHNRDQFVLTIARLVKGISLYASVKDDDTYAS